MVRVRRRWSERPRAGDAEPAYAAFLSYSHAADDRLAGALQRAIQRLAKPWYRMRALRVFRDQSSLAANPALWPSIQDALDRSEAFILLAARKRRTPRGCGGRSSTGFAATVRRSAS